jgi:hypothetical protein
MEKSVILKTKKSAKLVFCDEIVDLPKLISSGLFVELLDSRLVCLDYDSIIDGKALRIY